MSDQHISEVTPVHQARTPFDLDAIDESWALKLLKECETDDAPITLRADNQAQVRRFQYDPTVYSEDDLDMSSERLLSAIECQKLAFEEKQQAKLEAELAGKCKSVFSLSRLKAFFAA